jgi:hypothetical protein
MHHGISGFLSLYPALTFHSCPADRDGIEGRCRGVCLVPARLVLSPGTNTPCPLSEHLTSVPDQSMSEGVLIEVSNRRSSPL